MSSAPHGSEIFYVVIFALATMMWLIGMVRMYGWRIWHWPWGVWFRRRPPS
jgi:hypothetical protein